MDSDYHHVSLELLENASFVAWAKGENVQEAHLWESWAGDDPERKDILNRAKELVLAFAGDPHEVSDAHIETKIQEALNLARSLEAQKRSWWKQIHFPIRYAAAVALILAALVFVAVRNYRTNPPELAYKEKASIEFGEITVKNTGRAFRYVQLPDGSSVVLHQNSSVTFTKEFKTGREVRLSGEAFFEVTKNREQPFFVYTDELVAKVLGTSFSIKAFENGNITVAVKTGKVSLFTEKDSRAEEYKTDKTLAALLLKSNEQAVYEKTEATLKRLESRSAVLLNIPIENQVFTYSETPVPIVFEALENAYGVNIEYNKESLAQCSITATLGDEPLENKLKWITTILEAEYSISGTTVTIKGNPCK